jgi:predicted metal-dependent peptidase
MDKIQKAIITLLQGEGVFYASLLMQMVRVSGASLPENALAGVSVQNGRIYLYVDPPRLEKFSVETVARILEHECLHLVLEHITRRGAKHPYIWNIATDLAANSLINGMDVGLLPGKEPFEKFARGKTSEFYYALLQNKIQGYSVTFNADGSITVKNDKTGEEHTYQPSGDHKEWEKSTGETADNLTREVIKQAVEEATKQARQQGKLPGGLEEIIDKLLGKEKVNWRKLLKQYIGNSVRADSKYSWKRESKRYGIDQKGKVRNRMISLALAIDTSGSISEQDFQEFMTEIYGLMKSYKTKVTVMECDAEVQKVYTLHKHGKVDTKFKGRGGTSFVPVFEYFEKNKRMKPDVLVYFTDLCGSFPEKETVRTVWVRTSQGYGASDHVPFGKLIIIPKQGEDDD